MPAGDLLVVGLDASAIAASASSSGHNVYAADYFGDRDTQSVTQMNYSLAHQVPGRSCGRVLEHFSPAGLVRLARRLVHEYCIEGILLGSGLEDSPEELKALEGLAPILGNPVDVISKVRDRVSFFDTLAKRRIRCPETIQAEDAKEAEEAARELGYPVVVKPVHGFGGADVKYIRDSKALQSVIRSEEEVLVQKYIRGIAASASVVGTGKESAVLMVNEQILGVRQFGASGRFTYCGNIVPLVVSRSALKRCQSISAEVSNTFGLVGSNGVDFVLDECGLPWVVEVNPRFQGTIECVEKVLGINLVEAHLAACSGRLTDLPKVSPRFSARLVLYGRQRCSVPDLSVFTEVRDIPFYGVIVEKGEPVCSVVTEGKTKAQCIGNAKGLAKQVYVLLAPE